MATSEVIYLGHLSTSAVHLKSESRITTDAPIDNHGLGSTFSPTDLLATSLASCMLTIMGIRAEESPPDISGTKATVTKIMGSAPRKVAEIVVEIVVHAKDLDRKYRTVLEKAARNCPVALKPERVCGSAYNVQIH